MEYIEDKIDYYNMRFLYHFKLNNTLRFFDKNGNKYCDNYNLSLDDAKLILLDELQPKKETFYEVDQESEESSNEEISK